MLRLGDAALPTPGPGQVRLRVEACGLNPVDVKLMARGDPAWSWPHIPGVDAVGIVDAVGDGVDPARLGRREAGHGFLEQDGALAEHVVEDAVALAAVPDGVVPEVAAALPCAAMTAYQAVVDRMHVAADDTVLVMAGGGAVGGFAVQLAAATGARVIATASARDRDRVLRLGASDVVDHRTEDVRARVLRLTDGRGVDRIVDVLPAPSATLGLGLLAHGGAIACIGDRAEVSGVPPFTLAPSVHEIALGAAHASSDLRARRRMSAILTELLARVAAGTLDPLLAGVLPLADAPAALELVGRGRAGGKLVIVP